MKEWLEEEKEKKSVGRGEGKNRSVGGESIGTQREA